MSRQLATTAGVWSIMLLALACSADETPPSAEEDRRPTVADAREQLLEDGDLGELLGEPEPELAPFVPRACTANDCETRPLARWTFDDCDDGAASLAEANGSGLELARSPELQCADGWSKRALAFAGANDVAHLVARPGLDFEHGLTVAVWAKPAATDGVRTLVRKRSGRDSAFALVVHEGQYRIVVRLASGRAIDLAAPAVRDRGTHVAATYDGSELRLYLDGSEVARRRAPGAIAPGEGPLLIGNDGSRRWFEGALDEAAIDARALPAHGLGDLTCQRREPALSVTAEPSEPVPSGTSVRYTLTLTSRSEASCPPEAFLTSVSPPQGERIRSEPSSLTSPPIAGGESASLEIEITSDAAQESGRYPLQFFARSLLSNPGAVLAAKADASYVLAEPEGCHVAPSRTLLIRHPSVVDDPERTTARGAFSFGQLLTQAAPSTETAPALVEDMFRSFSTEQTINGFRVRARPGMQSNVLAPWPRTAAGAFDLERAPLRLLAIAHRLDLADFARGRAGEGRFVFAVLAADGSALLFTVILEYALPARDEADVRAWARAVHALQAEPFPSAAYNRALQALTERYTARGALPEQPNASALLRIRTNEASLGRDGRWEMREFRLARDGRSLEPAPLAQTPDPSWNGTATLAQFVGAHETSILSEKHDVPPLLDGAPFQAGTLINDLGQWDAPGIANPELRHRFSLNTCDGCHGGETFTSFFHVFPRAAGEQSLLSGFLNGESGTDPISGERRSYNELARRRELLEREVCD